MRLNDAVIGAVLILAALTMMAYTTTFPAFPGQKYGPSLFPQLLGSGLVICGILMIVRGLAARAEGESWVALAGWTREPWRIVSFFLVIALIVAYIFVSEQIGFLPVAFAMLLILFLWFRVRPIVALPTAAVAVWVIHWFFASLMRVPLPRGLLTNIL